MSLNITNELDELVKSLKLYHFKNELNFNLSQNNDKNQDNINLLTKIINNLEKIELVDNKNKIQETFNEIDKMVYKRPWKKIPNFHKTVKIKEYLNENYKDKKIYDTIEKILLDAIDNKNYNKFELITYDQVLCKITAIPMLKQNSEGHFALELPNKNKKSKKI